jgi:putative copper resistance protein D
VATDLLILSRALQIGSGLMLVNVVAFRWLILLPAFKTASDEAWEFFTPLFFRLDLLFTGSGIVLFLSGANWLWATAAEMSGTSLPESLHGEILETVLGSTQFGHLFLARAGLGSVLALASWKLLRTGWQSRRFCSPLERVAGIIAAALLISFAETGHAAASGGGAFLWNIIADSLHLLAASIWPAGLLPFAMFLARARRFKNASAFPLISKSVVRFSTISLVTVGVLTATGVVNGALLVGSLGALFHTPYGQVLCVKLALFSIVIGLAAWNRFCILPLLIFRASDPAGHDVRPSFKRLRTLVLTEFSLCVGIVLVVSVLGTLPPPR